MKTKPFTDAAGQQLGYNFYCPGCNEHHSVYVNHSCANANWSFNGDIDKPTFKPSVLIRSGHHAGHWKQGDPCWCTYKQQDPTCKFSCGVCHSFVTDGKIQFLNDCTHHLAGKTVDLPDLES